MSKSHPHHLVHLTQWPAFGSSQFRASAAPAQSSAQSAHSAPSHARSAVKGGALCQSEKMRAPGCAHMITPESFDPQFSMASTDRITLCLSPSVVFHPSHLLVHSWFQQRFQASNACPRTAQLVTLTAWCLSELFLQLLSLDFVSIGLLPPEERRVERRVRPRCAPNARASCGDHVTSVCQPAREKTPRNLAQSWTTTKSCRPRMGKHVETALLKMFLRGIASEKKSRPSLEKYPPTP